MPRNKLIRTNLYPYHITARSNNRKWFSLELKIVWSIFVQELARLQKEDNIFIYQFVLMSNHYHLLVATPKSNIDRVMNKLQMRVAKSINSKSGSINHVFGGPYKWSLIREHKYFHNVIRYIFQNPLQARVVNKCEDYKFSSLYFKSKNIPIGYSEHLEKLVEINDMAEFLILVNINNKTEEKAIEKALAKREFKITRNRSTGNLPFIAWHYQK